MGRHGLSSTRACCWATTLCCCSAGAWGVSTSGAGGGGSPHKQTGEPRVSQRSRTDGSEGRERPYMEVEWPSPVCGVPSGIQEGGVGGSVRARLVSQGWSVERVQENGRRGSSRGAGRELTGKWSPRARVRPWSDRWRRGCRPQRRFASSFDSRPFILPVSTSVAVSFSRRRCHSCGKCTGEKQSPCQVRSSSHSRPEPCGPKGRHTCSWTCGRMSRGHRAVPAMWSF